MDTNKQTNKSNYKTLSLFLKITLQFRTFADISGINNMNKKKTTTRKKATKKKQSIFVRVFKTILLSALLGAILVGLFVCCVYYGMWGKIPDYRNLREIRNNEASSLYSEDGELLGKILRGKPYERHVRQYIPQCRKRLDRH